MKHWGKLFVVSSLVIGLMSGCSFDVKESTNSGSLEVQSNNQVKDSNPSGAPSNVVSPLTVPKENLTTLATITGEQIVIYEDQEGHYVVEMQDKQYGFDWTGMTPRAIEPRLSYEDYDNDGQNELAIILYTGSGTGVSIEELHMLEMNEDATITDYMYTQEQYIKELEDKVNLVLDQQDQVLTATVSFDQQQVDVDLSTLLDEGYGQVNKELSWGNIVSYEWEGTQIIGQYKANVTVANRATPIIIGDVKTYIQYDQNGFQLQLDSFEVEQEIQ